MARTISTSSSTPAWNNSWGSLSPRIGFAYRLNEKTSLRAGFGRYYTPWEQVNSAGLEGANYYGFSVTSGAPSAILGVPQMSLSNPFPHRSAYTGNGKESWREYRTWRQRQLHQPRPAAATQRPA